MDEEMVISNDEVNAESDDNLSVISEHSDDESEHSEVVRARVRAIRPLSPENSSPEPEIPPNHHSTPNHHSAQAVTQKKNATPRFAEQSLDEDGQTCTICFEPWTNSSEHRLVSLRCGHLFGRSCITRWLKGQSSRCPNCNARARKSEIRNIYAKTVKSIDSSERDKALEELQKERELKRKALQEAASERMKHRMAVDECERLKKELFEANKLLQEYRSGSRHTELSQSSKKNVSLFSLEKIIEICKNGKCRIIDVCELLGMILVSQQSSNQLFPGYGFRKISTMEMKPSEFVLVHQKDIKDIAFHIHDGLVLTASMDKSVKITNVLTNSVVQTYALEQSVWSCAWDSDDPMYFYGGLNNGEVMLFDIRITNRSVYQLPRFGTNSPVVALQYLQNLPRDCQSKSGPLIAKFHECSFYKKLSQMTEYKVVPLPCYGPFSSVSSEPTSGHFLISGRPSPKQPRVSHTLCEIVSDPESEELVCNPVQTSFGGKSYTYLSKSKLVPHPDDASSLLICAGDEDSNGAVIWNGSSGNRLDCLKTESAVLDIAEVKLNQKSHLLALTKSNLKLYGWNNT